MIIAVIQIVALMMTAYYLVSFERRDCRYRFFVSLIASCWAGACFAISVAMVLSWPNAVESSNGWTAALTGMSLGAAWASGGNVAEVLRWFGCGRAQR